jgi:hypothetical protein
MLYFASVFHFFENFLFASFIMRVGLAVLLAVFCTAFLAALLVSTGMFDCIKRKKFCDYQN